MRLEKRNVALSPMLRLEVCGKWAWLAGEAARLGELLNGAAGKRIVAKRAPRTALPLTVTTMDELPSLSTIQPVKEPEGYVLSITPEGILVAGHDPAGIYYAAQTLTQLLSKEKRPSLPVGVIRDWPQLPIRGAHCYMPPREQLGFFFRFLDYIASLKYNTLILEFGGGMKYDKHPEINETWRKFAKEARAYDPNAPDPCPESKASAILPENPRGPMALQFSRYFPKDSIHPELGGGDCLTKNEVRAILAECAARHIEVIPEVQAFSHSYYLCCAHPEIAERQDDPWPDTYCPSNPKSYELLFDVMDEVIEVAKPRIMHIGHDELYTYGVCPKCRRRSGHDILADDVNKIHDFLASRGVRTMMWGDKFLNVQHGGTEMRGKDAVTGKEWFRPATWQAAEKVPEDLMILDWFWGIDPHSEEVFHKHAFTVTYGNFAPLTFDHWKERSGRPYVLGAEISSWCAVEPYAFGHNAILHDFFPGADMLWNGEKLPQRTICSLMAKWIHPKVEAVTGERRWLVSGKSGRVTAVPIGAVATTLPAELAGKLKTGRKTKTMLGTGSFSLHTNAKGVLQKSIVLSKAHPQIEVPVGRKAKTLLLLQASTMTGVLFELTFFAYHRNPAALLRYRVKYKDGREATFDSVYGDDIGNVHGFWPFPRVNWLLQYCFRAVPVKVDEVDPKTSGSDEAVNASLRTSNAPGYKFFAQDWTNPRPNAEIESITIALGPDATGNGEVLIPAISAVV